jgi:prepilin-type N-terminal cleavage/methylation domain-containing protein
MKQRKGFTLVELLVVVAIIGILITIAVPRFMSMTGSSKKAALQANHRIIISAVTMYMAEHNGGFPTADSQLTPYLPPSATSGLSGLAALQGNPEGSTYALTIGTRTLKSELADPELVLTYTFD